MSYSLETLKALRESTGAGVNDVKKALDEAAGDIAKATDILRKKGKVAALKKADRTAGEGVIGSYVHSNWKVGAFVALACETDFVARNPEFRDLAHNLALHVAAANPEYLRPSDVPAHVIEKEKEIVREQLRAENKPESVMEKILACKLERFYSEHCLLHQPFVKDNTMTVQELLEQAIAKIGEKVEITHYIRFTVS